MEVGGVLKMLRYATSLERRLWYPTCPLPGTVTRIGLWSWVLEELLFLILYEKGKRMAHCKHSCWIFNIQYTSDEGGSKNGTRKRKRNEADNRTNSQQQTHTRTDDAQQLALTQPKMTHLDHLNTERIKEITTPNLLISSDHLNALIDVLHSLFSRNTWGKG